jgi:ring-1,2-phenylacetyl-CoA epoxidase subunit PaaE
MRVNADPPFSCMSGACSTCMAKVISGSVKMERCLALDKSEVENGFILTCSSIPTSDEVEITYDV